ncbi:DUF1467 family protein [Ponticaulis sp.]|uniref:DUF1467 family protein n=1 Tax=Ponticaulis sp. TaxID=2020902 RepID=UPI002620B7A3|nr:DUF1467 family protein [Ponticaulis sp.]MDF1681540.1 DUF1467 family protein [Ponticaulis sp.]
MGIFSGSVVFLISWWMVFLAVLPIGVRGQHEDYVPDDGTEPGAPQAANLWKKAIWATIGAAVVTLIGFIIAISGILPEPDRIW